MFTYISDINIKHNYKVWLVVDYRIGTSDVDKIVHGRSQVDKLQIHEHELHWKNNLCFWIIYAKNISVNVLYDAFVGHFDTI